jgi:hypothetical protein
LPTGHHPAATRVLRAWYVLHRTACCIFFCFVFRRHIRNALLLMRATRLLRLYGICPDRVTAAMVTAFGCHNGLNRDCRARLDKMALLSL